MESIEFIMDETLVNRQRKTDPAKPKTSFDQVATSSLARQNFEFVTITELSSMKQNGTSKRIRTQAMRDYLRKQNKQVMTGVVETAEAVRLEDLSQHKGKFKLNTWSHKTKEKAEIARLKASAAQKNKSPVSKNKSSNSVDNLATRKRNKAGSQNVVYPVATNRLDPFDSLSINLGPLDEQLLVYYNTGYSMNSIAINPEGDFFSHVKTDPALFHSILYLVGLHYDLRNGFLDSPMTLYHGGEAFSILNSRLQDLYFSDMTIAAVAMLVNKENLNGKYDLSKIHMHGLQQMVKSRGGVEELRGVFQRIVTWSDFCFASVWNTQPRFSRLPLPNDIGSSALDSNPHHLKATHIFGSSSPIIPIITSLRSLSSSIASPLTRRTRLGLSHIIYHVEYSLLELNTLSNPPSPTEPSKCSFSFEAIPLKTAAHLFLWLAIRELPPTSELLYKLSRQLQESLELVLPGWWTSGWERQMWLLWMLFVGCVASTGRKERIWFVGEAAAVCKQLGIGTEDEFRESLERAMWLHSFCDERSKQMWEEIEQHWEFEDIPFGGAEWFDDSG